MEMNVLTEPISEMEVEETASAAMKFLEDVIPDLTSFGIRVLLTILFFVVGRALIQWVRKIVRASMQKANVDKGVEQFVDSLLKFGLYAILIFQIVTRFGVEPSSVAALIASGGVAIGLALQGTLSNFAGGVLILLLKPFVVGDYIIEDSCNNEGTVKEIQVFYTKLATSDNKTIVIPNGTLSNSSLTNVTAKENRRLDFQVRIPYEADLKQVKSLLEGILNADEDILHEEEMRVVVDDLAENYVIIGVKAWVKTERYWDARWRILEEVKLELDRAGVHAPYQKLILQKEK